MGFGERLLLAGRYRLLSELRRDGAGIVWHGHDLRLKRDVAIKEVRPPSWGERTDLRAARRHALREARLAARLSHPAIVTVHDLLEDRGRVWIVTELLQGLTLGETVRHLGRLPLRWAAWIGFQLLSGVRHAHAMGVLHGDIRPDTVLLTGDRVVLTDFGVAALDLDSPATATIPTARTGAYLAPERLRGEPPSAAADLWSFGATLYCGIEGRPPSPADQPVPPRWAGPLTDLLQGLLHRAPERRPPTERAAAVLAEFLWRHGIPAAPPGRRALIPAVSFRR